MGRIPGWAVREHDGPFVRKKNLAHIPSSSTVANVRKVDN